MSTDIVQADAVEPVLGEEPEEATELTPPEQLQAWTQRHSGKLLVALILAIIPYLIICNGMAIAIAKGLLGGTCGP